MSIYTVHEPPLKADESTPDPERFVFVRDGFYVLGLPAGAAVDAAAPAVAGACWSIVVVAVGARRSDCVLLGASSGVIVAVGAAARVAGRLRGRDAAALDAGAPRLEECRRRRRRRSRSGRAAVLRCLGRERMADRPRPRAAAGRRRIAGIGAARRAAAIIRGHRPVSAAGSVAVSVAIVDYGSGNLHSAAKAFERAAREERHRPADRGDARSGRGRGAPTAWCCPASAPSPIAGAGSMPSPAWSRRSRRRVRGKRPAVPRHLRRHAAHGRARPRIRGDRRASAGSRGEVDRIAPSDPTPEDPAYGLEHARRARGRIRCSTASPLGPDGLHAYFVHSYHLKAAERADLVARGRLWRAGHRRSSAATTWSAPSSIRRRASSLGLR